jgi:Zn-dependent protease
MLFSLLLANPLAFFVIAAGLVIAITVHEFAHAWTADYLGDPTPRSQGRVTLNPLAHLDPFGTLAILFVGFGWGRAVMFDPYNLKNPVKDTAMIALAGPVSNILMALALAVILAVALAAGVIDPQLIVPIIQIIISVNVMLAIFNLVPIHPLDGGKILAALLPEDTAREYDEFMYRYGTLVLIALIVPWSGGRSPVSLLIAPVINLVSSLYSFIWLPFV